MGPHGDRALMISPFLAATTTATLKLPTSTPLVKKGLHSEMHMLVIEHLAWYISILTPQDALISCGTSSAPNRTCNMRPIPSITHDWAVCY